MADSFLRAAAAAPERSPVAAAPRFLGGLDAPMVLAGSATMIAWSATTPESSGALLYGLTFLHVARGIYVPSTGRRTLILAGITGVGIATMTFLHVSITQQCMQKGAWAAVETALAWATAAFLATSTSNVIYGLRKEA